MKNLSGEKLEPAGIQEKKPTNISMLINSIHYFIQSVFILDFDDHYRLVALHNGKVLIDASYETLKGAKIAFSKMYGYKAWSEKIKAKWSHFYDPDTRWLDAKTKDIRPV